MNPVFAVCMRTMYINQRKLVEGVNSLEGVEDTFRIGIDKKDNSAELVDVSMDTLKQKECSKDGVTIACITIFVILLIIGCCIGLAFYVKKKRDNAAARESIDENPDYNNEGYDGGGCEVKDNNDYYFEDTPDDIAVVTDKNQYYQ